MTATFPDISELGRAAGFDLGFRQLDSGPAAVPAELFLAEHLTLVKLTLNRSFHQLGTPPAGVRSFGIPFRTMRNWFGNQYERDSILPFDVPGGIDGVSEAGFKACTMSVTPEYLEYVSETFQIPARDVLFDARANSIIRNGKATQLFRRLIWESFADSSVRLDRQRKEEIILALLRSAQRGAAIADKSGPFKRSRAVRAAIAYIDSQVGEAITVGDVCRNTGVSLRTLNRAFRERFGMGPKAYLIRQRLSAAHVELVRMADNSPIADVANRHGFWHMGQFARDYKTIFGELPSETLRQNSSSVRNRLGPVRTDPDRTEADTEFPGQDSDIS